MPAKALVAAADFRRFLLVNFMVLITPMGFTDKGRFENQGGTVRSLLIAKDERIELTAVDVELQRNRLSREMAEV